MPRKTFTEAYRGDPDLAPLISGRNPDGSIYTLPVTSAAAELAEAGAVWVASSRQAPGASAVASFAFDNPAGSEALVLILAVRAWASTHLPVRIVRGATSTGGAMSVVNSDFSRTDAPGIVPVAGVNVLTGGTIVGQGGVDPGAPYERSGPFRLPPGVAMALTITAPGGLTGSADVAASVDYAIVPA